MAVFDGIGDDDFRRMAMDDSLSAHEKIGFQAPIGRP